MDKLISQQAAINVVSEITTTMSVCANKDECYGMKRMQKQAITELANLPSAEPEAISKWKREFKGYVDSLNIARDDWKGIIEYIDELPSVQPETNCSEIPNNSDTVSRRQAIDVLHGYFDGMLETDTVCPADIYGLFECMPSVQPERLKGNWIHQPKFSRIECDQCGKVFRNTFAPKNFCPNCGAKMDSERKE